MFGDKCGGYMMYLVNQLLKLLPINEHDDAADVLESAMQLARSSAQAGVRLFLVGGY